MQKWLLAIALLALGITSTSAQSYEARAREYVNQFKELAMREQKRSGVPASITLAQGIHETSAGGSELATNANNHFGIKCKKSWTGETYSYTDDAPNECFRKYSSPEQSYVDHSDYLSTSPRYAVLFTYAPTDYASWARGLKKCGYATNPRYAQVLINLVEEYKLQEYTYAAMNNNIGKDVAKNNRQNEIVPEHDATAAPVAMPDATIPTPVTTAAVSGASTSSLERRKSSKIVVRENAIENTSAEPSEFPPYGEVVKVNGLKAVYGRKGDMPLEYALKTDVRYEKLLEINDISDRPLAEDMYLYLERKHLKGIRPVHVVKEGETIDQVSRFEGMSAKSIRSLNLLGSNEEPVPGTVLQLQTNAPVRPQTIASTTPAMPPAPPAEEAPSTPLIAATEVAPAPQAGPEPTATEPAATDNTIATTPVEEHTLAGNTSIEPTINTPEPPPTPAALTEEQPAVAQVTEKADIGTTVPVEATPATTEAATPQAALPNPPATINIANEKPIEEVIAEEKKTQAVMPQPEPVKQEEPKDELDMLKARFDKVVYAKRNAAEAASTPTAEVTPAAPTAAAVPEATPNVTAATEPEVKTEPVTASTGAKYYVVKKGDTAFSIAKRNNITMRQLMDWNSLDFEAIKVGQRLKIQP
jgi:LysM repeat protein